MKEDKIEHFIKFQPFAKYLILKVFMCLSNRAKVILVPVNGNALLS